MMLHFMKTTLATLLIVAGTLDGVAAGLAQTKDAAPPPEKDVAAPETAGPKIQFADAVYDFGKIGAGELVKHEFVFTNIGTATLEIKDVRPGCGCTTAGTWDRRVEPGKTGVIPLQFDSSKFDGMVAKQATVTCNDPGQSNVTLQIKGTVWKAIEVTPAMAVINIPSEQQARETKIVRIVSRLDEPLTLSDLQCTNRAFETELKTVRPGKEFELHITAVPPFGLSSVIAPVTLKTSSSNMPLITVSAHLVVQQPITVMPNQIVLPPGPLTNGTHHVVTIRNSGTNALVLSEVGVNLPGAEVRVQETQPGRLFNLVVDFPAGLQIRPDQKVEVTVKSNHPRFPLIQVPVSQRQRPAVIQNLSSPLKGTPTGTAPPVAGK